MKTIILTLSLIICLSCHKTHVDPNAPVVPGPKELSNPLFESYFGDAYEYDAIKHNPITLLTSGNMMVSSIEAVNTIDKLQFSKIDASGNVLWQTMFTAGFRYQAGSCFETSTGHIIALGAKIDQSDWVNSKVFIAKLNATTGDTVWVRTYGYNYIDRGVMGCEDANQNYWVVDFNNLDGKATFLKIGPNGDSLTSVLNTALVSTYRDAMVTHTKKIVLVGESENFTSSKQPVYICSYTNGVRDFSSDIVLDNFDQVRVADVCETSDGAYAVTGECSNFSQGIRSSFLLKVDAAGNKVWERVFPAINGAGIASCIEKQPDVFYLGADASGGGLFKYDLTTLKNLNAVGATQYNDMQLLKNGSVLYRVLFDVRPSYYATVSLKKYTILQ